jgi:hypothetical protein
MNPKQTQAVLSILRQILAAPMSNDAKVVTMQRVVEYAEVCR